MDSRLREQEVLRRKKDFERVLFRGKCRRQGALRLYYDPAPVETGMRRAAFLAGGKFPSNVARNRIRRRLREIYRVNKERFCPNFDFILRADARALALSPLVLSQTMLSLVERVDDELPIARDRARKNHPASARSADRARPDS